MTIQAQHQLIDTMKAADKIAMRARKSSPTRKAAIALRDKAFRQFVWGE